MEALGQLEAELAARGGFARGFDAFGKRDDAQVADEGDEAGGDEESLGAGAGQVADEAAIELDEVGSDAGQLVEAGLAGSKIIVGEQHFQVTGYLAQLEKHFFVGDRKSVV